MKQRRAAEYERMQRIVETLSSLKWKNWGNPFKEVPPPSLVLPLFAADELERARASFHPTHGGDRLCCCSRLFLATQLITPENCVSMGVPDYFMIVKQPMSLDLIATRIQGRQYASFSHFEADVQLVIANAKLFNREGEAVHRFAVELEQRFRDLVSGGQQSK